MKMNFKLKTLLVLSGAALLSVPALQAQHGSAAHASAAARPAMMARPTTNGALHSGRFANSRFSRNGYYGHGSGNYGHGSGNYGHHHYGRYYYLGGIPYFYPFYGYGFGYPSYYYDGFYGNGFAGGYEGGYPGGTYEGRISSRGNGDENADRNEGSQPSSGSLPSAVQRQLSKRGYYKGTVDGQFGPASRDALSRFQKSQGLKSTGKIDEDTLDALGFTDQR